MQFVTAFLMFIGDFLYTSLDFLSVMAYNLFCGNMLTTFRVVSTTGNADFIPLRDYSRLDKRWREVK